MPPSQDAAGLASRCEEVAKRFDTAAPIDSTAGSGGPSSGTAPANVDVARAAASSQSAPDTTEGAAASAAAPVPAADAPLAAGSTATDAAAAAAPAPAVAHAAAPTLAAPRPKPLPVPIAGTFTAVRKPSDKAPVGTVRFEVSIPWDDDKMYSKAKMSMYVPPVAKVISTTLPNKPRNGTLSVTLNLPSSVGTDDFALGAVAITSGPNPTPRPVMAQPLVGGASAAMPVVAAVPIPAVQSTLAQAAAAAAAAAAVTPSMAARPPTGKVKRSNAAPTGSRKKKAVAPAAPDLAADATFVPPDGMSVLPCPATVNMQTLRGKLICHRFDIATWPSVFGLGGKAQRVSSDEGFFEIKYPGFKVHAPPHNSNIYSFPGISWSSLRHRSSIFTH